MRRKCNRIMIAGMKSGSGKTTLTCGVLQLLVNRGLSVASLKCGPDYIDPAFHEKVLGVRSGNLDGYFFEDEVLSSLLSKHGQNKDITVIEGVMGYYDGLGMKSIGGSFHVSMATKTPVVLVIDCKGMAESIGAILHGFLTYRPNQIRGVIFNRLPAQLYEPLKEVAENMGICVLGYVPTLKEFQLESRHLGLVTADEIHDIKNKIEGLALKLAETIDIDGLLELAGKAPELPAYQQRSNQEQQVNKKIRIAVAKDEAFCFIYQDNINLLEELGCEIMYFSPLHDKSIPTEADGMLLYGGYPELYAKQLSSNQSMITSIREAIKNGLPTIAECGGFMYLHEWIEDREGNRYPMAAVLEGGCYKTNRLQRFGYVELEAAVDNLLCKKGDKIKAHEFHYWDSEHTGDGFVAQKPFKQINWKCAYATKTLYAGYPHIHFYANTNVARQFVEACRTENV
ncbi:MAG: cobyrinate a,c-diamide synthase [bacterium]|nr:cobyrinate a,c-diamide synthase [bacterium]